MHPPAALGGADAVPFEELELHVHMHSAHGETGMHVSRGFAGPDGGQDVRTISGCLPGGPVLNRVKAGGGGTSQMRVSVAKSRRASMSALVGFARLGYQQGLRQTRGSTTWPAPTQRNSFRCMLDGGRQMRRLFKHRDNLEVLTTEAFSQKGML